MNIPVPPFAKWGRGISPKGVNFLGNRLELKIWPKITSLLLVPKLPLGNGVLEAPASRRTAKQELAR